MISFRGIVLSTGKISIGDIYNPKLSYTLKKGIYKCYVLHKNDEINALLFIKEGYTDLGNVIEKNIPIYSPSEFVGFFCEGYKGKNVKSIEESCIFEVEEDYKIKKIKLCLVTQKYFVGSLDTKDYVLIKGEHGFKIVKQTNEVTI